MSNIRDRIMQCNTQPIVHESADLGTVYLRRMTLGELNKMQEENAAKPVTGKVPISASVRLLARFIGDEQGKPVFNLEDQKDVDTLLGLPVTVVADLLNAGNRVNNMKEEEPGKP